MSPELRRTLFGLAFLATACGNGVGPPTSLADASSGDGATANAETATTGTTAADTSGLPTTGAGESVAGSTEIVVFDSPQSDCDPWMQNCPDGDKCSWYADDGGSAWNATRCVPILVDAAQIGEMCTVRDGATSGADNCDLGLMCWDLDENNEGSCVALCTGSQDAAMCGPGTTCSIDGSGLALCFEGCDPLAQDCPTDGDMCIAVGDGFQCTLDASGDEGQAHDACEFPDACDPGNICLGPNAAAECDPDATGCCEPYCDTSAANTCPGQGQQCLPFYGVDEPPPEHANLGICSLPP